MASCLLVAFHCIRQIDVDAQARLQNYCHMLGGRNILFALVLLVGGQSLHAQTLPSTSLSLVLLTNGRLIEGSLIEGKDYSRILFPTGGEIRLPAEAIRFACRSKQDAYWKQRLRLSIRDSAMHYDLAVWCLNEGLTNLAKEQVQACLQTDMPPQKIEFLRKRIKLLEESDPAVDPRRAVLPKAVASNEERVAVSTESVLAYTQSVQPILLNRCAAASCHSNRVNNGFQLIRPLQGRSLAREYTLRNLNAVVAQLEATETSKQEFSRHLHTPHGGIDTPPVTAADQIEAITKWISELNEHREPELADSVQSPRTFLSQPDTRIARWNDRDKRQPKFKDAYPQPTGADPFDPDVFNKRYHPQGDSR